MLHNSPRNQNQRGSLLAVTFFLIFLTAVGTLVMTSSLLDHQRLNKRRRDFQAAFYAAEAGVAQVIHWGNFPSQYTDDDDLFARDLVTGEFPEIATLTTTEVSSDLLFECESKYDYEVAEVEQIRLIPADPANDLVPCLFKVQSVGKASENVRRTILAYIEENPLSNANLALPAALISLSTAATGGNARIFWGEAWSKTAFNMPNKSQMNYLMSDSWASYRTEDLFSFPANWHWGVGDDLFDPARPLIGNAPASGDYEDAFEQKIPTGTLQWPDFNTQYQVFKDMAIARGRYYSTDASNKIYRDGIENPLYEVDFVTEFEISDHATSPYDFAFIDTIDGNPPAADGSNLATITSAGTGTGLKGVFYMAANFVQTGVGNPPTLVGAENPDGDPFNLLKIYLDGVLYTSGTVDFGGNVGIYGSVVADKGFTGSGTPDIYYNYRLASGLEIRNGNVGSVFRVALQTDV